MKPLLLILLFSGFSLPVFSQEKLSKKSPVIFLDSVQISLMSGLDPNNMADINIVHKDSLYPGGSIYITSKKTNHISLITTKDILKGQNLPPETPVIFILNNEIVRDTTNFRIEASFLLRVEMIKASEFHYLPENISNLTILKLFTGRKVDNINQKIRGNSLTRLNHPR